MLTGAEPVLYVERGAGLPRRPAQAVERAYARGVEQVPNGEFVAVLLLPYTLGDHEQRARGLIAMLAAAGVFMVQDRADLEAGYKNARQDVGFYVLFFLAWGAGVGIRALRGRAELLERLTDQLERERSETARLAALEERTRVAREMHDVVAHGVAVMVLHAGAPRTLVDGEPERAKSTLRSAEDSARRLLRDQPAIRVAMLTTFDLDSYLYEALKMGVSGFFLKDDPPEQIVAGIRAVIAGAALLAPSLTQRVIATYVRGPAPRRSCSPTRPGS